MSTWQIRVTGVVLSFVLIILSGIWLSHLGKPYNAGVFAVHKLVGVAAGVLLGIMVFQAHKATPLDAVQISAIVITVLFFMGTVVAGGLLSVNLEVPAFVQKLHRFLPVLTAFSTAATLYLLLRRG